MSSENKEPVRADFAPVEVAPGIWEVPGSNVGHRSKSEANNAADEAHWHAHEDWYREDYRLNPSPRLTPKGEAVEGIRAAKADAMAQGVSEDEWRDSPEIRARFIPGEKSGAEQYREWKRNPNRGSSSHG